MLSRAFAAAAVGGLCLWAAPAQAGRTVIDGGVMKPISGYCSPIATIRTPADCAPVALGFELQIGGQSYDSFVVNSNGVLSLGAPVDFSGASPQLSGLLPPVFSPLLDNSARFSYLGTGTEMGNDGAFVGDYAKTADSLTVRWYACSTAIFCGPQSLSSMLYDGGGLTQDQIKLRQNANWSMMTLTKLGNGFSVAYDYTPRYNYGLSGEAIPSTDPIHYGFDLPTASFEANGAALSRTFYFDSTGELLEGAVPEPATWAMMLIGFGAIGTALRSGSRRRVAAA